MTIKSSEQIMNMYKLNKNFEKSLSLEVSINLYNLSICFRKERNYEAYYSEMDNKLEEASKVDFLKAATAIIESINIMQTK
jgi:hypothetical protein